jgi:hypothetical protein
VNSVEQNQAFSILDGLRQQMVLQHAQGQAQQLAGLFVEDGELLLPQDDSATRGQGAIESRYETLFAQFEAELVLNPDESRIIDAETAFENGEFSLVLRPQGGAAAEPLQFTGTYELRGLLLHPGGLKVTSFTLSGPS